MPDSRLRSFQRRHRTWAAVTALNLLGGSTAVLIWGIQMLNGEDISRWIGCGALSMFLLPFNAAGMELAGQRMRRAASGA